MIHPVPPWAPWEPCSSEYEPGRICRRWPSGAIAAWVRPWTPRGGRLPTEKLWWWLVQGPRGGLWQMGQADTRQGAQRAATVALLRRWEAA